MGRDPAVENRDRREWFRVGGGRLVQAADVEREFRRLNAEVRALKHALRAALRALAKTDV